MAKATYDAPAVRKAIAVIELLCESTHPLGVTEICQSLELNNNMVFRLLHTMLEEGWITQVDGPKYTMSLVPFHHLSKPAQRMDINKAAHGPLQKLWEVTGESCYLGIIDGTQTLFLQHLDAIGDIRIAANPGGKFMMHCAAPGKVLMAYAGNRFVNQVIKEHGLPAQTDKTLVTTETLKEDLKQIRENGFGLDLEEFADGLICLAAPVFDCEGNLAGTIGLSVLTLYYSEDQLRNELGPKVIEAARETSQILGHVS